MKNPLIDIPKETNETFIPFDQIKDEHFEPAFEVALQKAKENLHKLIENKEAPTFNNTIEALEDISPELDYVASIFGNLKEAHVTDEINRLGDVILPKLSDFGNDILLNEKLFLRIKEVYESNPVLETNEERRLLEKTYKNFTRNGALLNEEGKQLLREYSKELSLLSKQFGQNILTDSNAYSLLITDEKDLAGLPERVIETAKEEAEAHDLQGWVFTLKAPSVSAFLQYADNAELRREMYMALNTRGTKGDTNNWPLVEKIISFRNKKAQLLGYENHVAYVLDERMAKDKKTLTTFFETLRENAFPRADEEFKELIKYKERNTGSAEIAGWDSSYFLEKLQKEKYNFSEEELRPYLSLENVVNGVFEHAKRLYGLEVTKREDIPVYHSDVVVYEIKDESGNHMGILYTDFFPRASKRAGGWIDAIRMQHKKNGVNIRPHLVIVCNLTKPTKKTPSLLDPYEAMTIFHEFGHALHCLLSDCQYKSLAGFNTSWDFVELPSQLMQQWVDQKEALDIFARHYETEELLPSALYEKFKSSKNFFAGVGTLGQLGMAVLDVALHDAKANENLAVFEHELLNKYRFITPPGDTSRTTVFKHVFDGGYDVGYYSYQWAEVLAADAFEYFKEEGLFSKEVASKFRKEVLSKGNTEEPMELYKKFRGREPDPKALLRLKGLL